MLTTGIISSPAKAVHNKTSWHNCLASNPEYCIFFLVSDISWEELSTLVLRTHCRLVRIIDQQPIKCKAGFLSDSLRVTLLDILIQHYNAKINMRHIFKVTSDWLCGEIGWEDKGSVCGTKYATHPYIVSLHRQHFVPD